MPQLVLFRRRWKVASDTIPMLTAFLAIFHLLFLLPLIVVSSTTESQAYECNKKTTVRTALFGTFALYLLSATNEIGITWSGLRGGPLEEKRRHLVRPLLHLEFLLWVIILAFTCYATYVGSSPTLAASCWSDNPCEYSIDTIPAACQVNGTADVVLTPSCLAIWNNSDEFDQCFSTWMDYAATAFVTYYHYSVPNPAFTTLNTNYSELIAVFNPIDPATYTCNDSISLDSKEFEAFMGQIYGANALQEEEDRIMWESQQERLSLEYELYVLELLGVPTTNTTTGSDAPWFKCFSEECAAFIVAGDECTSWREMGNVPSASDRKSAYLATVYASWGLLILQALVVYVVFNAWPEYENEESWQGALHRYGTCLCCADKLEEAETDNGQQAAKEIGSLLHILFGGIDLDPSDQFLGMFLVSERQRLRRHRYALTALKEAGIEPGPAQKSWMKRGCVAVFVSPVTRFRDWYHSRQDVKLASTLEEVVTSTSTSSSSTSTFMDGIQTTPTTTATTSAAVVVSSTAAAAAVVVVAPPPSPFDVPATATDTIPEDEDDDGDTAPSLAQPLKSKPDFAYTPPAIAESVVRLVSLRQSPSMAATSSSSSISPSQALSAPESQRKSSWLSWFSGGGGGGGGGRTTTTANSPTTTDKVVVVTTTSGPSVSGHSSLPPELLSKKLVVDAQVRPLVTPVMLRSIVPRLPISGYEAARVYGMGRQSAVSHAELSEVKSMCALAKAAYGLQTIRWAYASDSVGCAASTWDKCLSSAVCAPCRGPLGFDSHFRKRNFSAILDLAGIEAGDLLYVSYTSAAFGVLPYMVMLHHASRSVVVGVRGTVGIDDLLTDLLSNSVDASKAMPDWVKEAVGEGAPMYAHAGIMSSTNAVLKDLQENGLLEAMMTRAGSSSSSGSGSSSSFGNSTNSTIETTAPETVEASRTETQRVMSRLRTMNDDDEVHLDLLRAKTMVNRTVAEEGWRVVVTGHSLGAAVACMLSFQLREHFPTLRCFAFSPPGGLISSPLAQLSQKFCTSVVTGCDAITRLSFPNTQRVVDDMVLALARCKRPKLAILGDIVIGRRRNPDSTPPTFCTFEDIGPEAQAALKKYVATSKLHAANADGRELLPPGKVIHLRPFAAPDELAKRKGSMGEVWDAVWGCSEDILAEGIILNKAMLRHHRLPTTDMALQSALDGEAAALVKSSADETV